VIRAQVETGAGFVWELTLDTSNTTVVEMKVDEAGESAVVEFASDPQIDMKFVETMLRDAMDLRAEGSWILSASVDGVELGDDWIDSLNKTIDGS
jgi:hypothetical protein